jgi:hypothetical protein
MADSFFPGAVGADVPIGATYIYNLNFFCGFAVAGVVYWGLCRLFPIPATSDVWLEARADVEEFTAAYDSPRDGGGVDGASALGSRADGRDEEESIGDELAKRSEHDSVSSAGKGGSGAARSRERIG